MKKNIAIVLILITVASIIFNLNLIEVTKAEDNKEVLEERTIIPKPLTFNRGKGEFLLDNKTSILVKGRTEEETTELLKVGEFLKSKIKPATGFDLQVLKAGNSDKNVILLTTVEGEESQGNEGYDLTINPLKITIKSFKPEGIFRGVQSLRQLLPSDIFKNSFVKRDKWDIQEGNIKDKPEYSYRSFMIDVARTFYPVEEIKRQIDFASLYKINKLHLHLTDDQGWRIEIKKYPDLTLIGGSTEVGGGPGGYFTQEQFKDIVKYASERYIEIIPEVDMPGHSNAALASYGFLNPDGKKKELYTGIKVGFSSFMTHDEKTYEFLEDVIKEISEISPSKYFHVGGDEADNTKKEDYDYFEDRVTNIVKKYNKIPIGWDPIDTVPKIDSSTILENWKDSNEAAVKKNMNMVIAIAEKTYLDMKYNKDTPYGLDWAGLIPIDVAYNWDPTEFAPKNLVLGIEAPLWTENVKGQKQMDYMVYPRLLGYGEIGWTPKSSRNWEEYKVRLKNQGENMSNLGIGYYRDNSIWNN